MKTKKNPKLNLEKRRKSFFMMGAIVACSCTLVAFQWTTYSTPNHHVVIADEIIELESLPPVIKPKQKVMTRPPKQFDISKAPIIDSTLVAMDTTDFTAPMDSNLVFADLFGDDTTASTGGGYVEPDIFVIVENMPAWKGCKSKKSEERKDYTDTKIFAFLGKNIKYPRPCIDARISGVVYVEYIINEKGQITNAQVVRGAHSLLDKEALRVVNNMPDFDPGKQRGIPVNVKFTLPIRFTLE